MVHSCHLWFLAVSVGGRHAGYCRSDLITPHVKDYYVEWEGVIKTSTGSANLRTAASSSAAKVTGSPYANGTNVHVFGETTGADGYTWYYLSVENKYVGYCRCDLVMTTTDYPNWWGKANTTTGTLNIRSGAGTEYSLISGCPNVKNGTQMKVTRQVCGNDGDVWYKVTVNGTYKGYVKGKLVIPVNTVAYSSWLGCARSTTGTVNVRSQASTASSIISGYPQLKNGDCFDVIGQVSGTDGYLWFYEYFIRYCCCRSNNYNWCCGFIFMPAGAIATVTAFVLTVQLLTIYKYDSIYVKTMGCKLKQLSYIPWRV